MQLTCFIPWVHICEFYCAAYHSYGYHLPAETAASLPAHASFASCAWFHYPCPASALGTSSHVKSNLPLLSCCIESYSPDITVDMCICYSLTLSAYTLPAIGCRVCLRWEQLEAELTPAMPCSGELWQHVSYSLEACSHKLWVRIERGHILVNGGSSRTYSGKPS